MHVVHIGILGDVVASILVDLLQSGNLAMILHVQLHNSHHA